MWASMAFKFLSRYEGEKVKAVSVRALALSPLEPLKKNILKGFTEYFQLFLL